MSLAHVFDALVNAVVAGLSGWCGAKAGIAWAETRDMAVTQVTVRPQAPPPPTKDIAPELPAHKAPEPKRLNPIRRMLGNAAAAPAIHDIVRLEGATTFRESAHFDPRKLTRSQQLIFDSIADEIGLVDIEPGEPLLVLWQGKEWPCIANSRVMQDGEGKPFVNVAKLTPKRIVPISLAHIRRPL